MRLRLSSQYPSQQEFKTSRNLNHSDPSLKTSVVTMPSEGGITFNNYLMGSPLKRARRQKQQRKYNTRQLDAIASLKSSDLQYQNLEIEVVECDYLLIKAKQTVRQLQQQLWESSKPLAKLQGQVSIHEGIVLRKEAMIRMFCQKLADETDIPSIWQMEKGLKQQIQEYRQSSQNQIDRLNTLCQNVLDQQTQLRTVNDKMRLQIEQIQQKTIVLQHQTLNQQKRYQRRVLDRQQLIAKSQIYEQQKMTLELKSTSLENQQKFIRDLLTLEEEHSRVISQLECSIRAHEMHRTYQQHQRRLDQIQEMIRLIPSLKQSTDQLHKENSKLQSTIQGVNKILWRLKESLHRITIRQTSLLEHS